MTSIAEHVVPCPLCTRKHRQLVLESTSSFGPPDLDTRPAPPARDAFVYEVAACPSCGLVFEPLPWEETEWVEDAPGLRSLLAGAGYRSPDRQLPEPAALFRRASLIAQHNHQHDARLALR